MKVLQERSLQVTTEGEVDAWRFDDESHGLSHCMKAIDFIVEFPDRYLFLEFKDPQHPQAPQQDRDKFIREFQSGELDEDLKYKYRDSFLYEWAAGRVHKPVYYFVLIAADFLTHADLTTRTDALARILPLHGPSSGSWTHQIVENCAVFNLDSWNQHIPQCQVSRLKP